VIPVVLDGRQLPKPERNPVSRDSQAPESTTHHTRRPGAPVRPATRPVVCPRGHRCGIRGRRVIFGVPQTDAQPGNLSRVAGFLHPFSWRVHLPQRGASTHTRHLAGIIRHVAPSAAGRADGGKSQVGAVRDQMIPARYRPRRW